MLEHTISVFLKSKIQCFGSSYDAFVCCVGKLGDQFYQKSVSPTHRIIIYLKNFHKWTGMQIGVLHENVSICLVYYAQ